MAGRRFDFIAQLNERIDDASQQSQPAGGQLDQSQLPQQALASGGAAATHAAAHTQSQAEPRQQLLSSALMHQQEAGMGFGGPVFGGALHTQGSSSAAAPPQRLSDDLDFWLTADFEDDDGFNRDLGIAAPQHPSTSHPQLPPISALASTLPPMPAHPVLQQQEEHYRSLLQQQLAHLARQEQEQQQQQQQQRQQQQQQQQQTQPQAADTITISPAALQQYIASVVSSMTSGQPQSVPVPTTIPPAAIHGQSGIGGGQGLAPITIPANLGADARSIMLPQSLLSPASSLSAVLAPIGATPSSASSTSSGATPPSSASTFVAALAAAAAAAVNSSATSNTQSSSKRSSQKRPAPSSPPLPTMSLPPVDAGADASISAAAAASVAAAASAAAAAVKVDVKGKQPIREQESEKPKEKDEDELDKRRRNTAASARFRAKKKAREQAIEQTAREMTERVMLLEQRLREQDMEIRWLRQLVVERNGPKRLSEMYSESGMQMETATSLQLQQQQQQAQQRQALEDDHPGPSAEQELAQDQLIHIPLASLGNLAALRHFGNSGGEGAGLSIPQISSEQIAAAVALALNAHQRARDNNGGGANDSKR
ncbi:chromatin binding protein [Polyrhizophydium stewartii]|uniref:Chromatin binding protein n=1 Tax=Polyrhizophydium stewartii TaxID=2732419 RepID=A0ABR4N0K3_9FUNG